MYTIYINGVEKEPKNVGSLVLEIEKVRENAAYFSRVNLATALRYDKDDYDYFDAITDICQKVTVRIDENCDGSIETIFEGYTTRLNWSFNPDKCIVECEVETEDAYTCLLDNMKTEINWLDDPIIPSDPIRVNSIPYLEFLVESPTTPPAELLNWDFLESVFVGAGITEELVNIYARQRVVVGCVGGVPQAPADFEGVIPYTLLVNNCGTTGTSEYWRVLSVLEQGTISTQNESCTPVPCVPPAPPFPDAVSFIGQYVGAFNVADFYAINNIYDYTDLENGRFFFNVINHMLGVIGCGLTLESDFFSNVTNPVTGLPSTTRSLTMFDKGDVVRPTASEKASKNITTFTDMFTDPKVLFNTRWKINNSTNKLVIEHISDLGLVVGLDLTTYQGGVYAKKRNQYDYSNAEVPKDEKFKFPIEALGIDFAGLPIEYSVSCKGVEEKIHQTTKIETELSEIMNNEDAGTTGIVLVSPFTVNSSGFNSSLSQNGRITNVFQPNAPLGFAALLPDYGTWDRPLPEGTVNNNLTVFDSSIPLRTQQELKPRLCCFSDFDPNKLVRTELGDGEVKSASYNLKTRVLALVLEF